MTEVGCRADCTPKCRSSQHAGELVTALSHNVSEEAVLAWLVRHCHAPGRARDKTGRSVVHAAASTGRIRVLQWIINHKDGALNGKDGESGYSPLHRAVFHGQLPSVVFLIRQGANLSLADNNGLTALDHAIADRPLHVSYEKHMPLEAYVWGTNANYNLGLGTNTTRNNPDILNQFRSEGTTISKVCLQKFHSAFVTRNGSVFTCGNGMGGRLGHGSETMQLIPKAVQLSGSCVDASLGVDHSMFLNEHGMVYTCGMNTYHQLGHHPPPPRLLAPAPIFPRGKGHPSAKGVVATRFHSIFWTEDAVYTWGLNAGQLGHIKGDKTIIVPKLVAALAGRDSKIESVVASDGASVVLTSKGDVLALYEYGSKKLGTRQHGVVKMEVMGGHLDPAVDPGGHDDIEFKLVAGGGSNLKVFLLSKIGKISVWEETRANSFIPCLITLSRQVIVTDIALHKTGLVLVGRDGVAWMGTHQRANRRPTSPVPKSPGALVKLLDRELCDTVKLKRIQHIHRGVSVACDSKGRNFSILQVFPNEALTEIPDIGPSTIGKHMQRLLEEASEFDPICDVICVVGNRRFPSHRFILASGAETLSNQLRFAEETVVTPMVLEIDDVHPDIFEQALKFMYYKNCDLMIEGKCSLKINLPVKPKDDFNENNLELSGSPATISAFAVYSENRGKKKKNSRGKQDLDITAQKQKTTNPILLLQEAAKNLGIYGLSKILDCFRYSPEGEISRKTPPPKPRLDFSRKHLTELHDVVIECEDEKDLYAHKCILSSRSEYFESMFASGWMECSQEGTISLPLPSNLVEVVLDYLYKDESGKIMKSEDPEFVSNVLVVADQFLMKRLVEICENQLSKLLSLKNVSEVLQFSFNYSAEQLQQSCMQFICINLPAILENKSLEFLEDGILTSLGTFYRNSNSVFPRRKMPPYSGYPSAVCIEKEYAEDSLSFEDIETAEECAKSSRKSKTRRNSSGDKRNSPRIRRTSSESFSSGSDSDNDESVGGHDFDKLSLVDFEIEEQDENSTPEPMSPLETSREGANLESETNQVQAKSYFTSLFASAPPDAGSVLPGLSSQETPQVKPKQEPVVKKVQKISQKERKRLSQEGPSPKLPTEVAAKTNWGGWGSVVGPSTDNSSSAPSLAEIMQMERSTTPEHSKRSPTPTDFVRKTTPTNAVPSTSGGTGGTTNRTPSFNGGTGGPTNRTRKLSEGGKTPDGGKKTSWKQLDWTSQDIKPESPARPNINPWNIPSSPSTGSNPWNTPQSPRCGFLEDGFKAGQSFQQILREEVKEKDNLDRARSKPLSVTQIEERAIEELGCFYNVENTFDEIISIDRVEKGKIATPVWNRFNKK